MTSIDPDQAWAAFTARDRAADGAFVVSVATTGIYCRPSCPARRPRREHIAYFASPAEAEQAGFRACLRCRPDHAARDGAAVAAAARLMAERGSLPLQALAAQVGYAPHHFHRLFKRATGVTPAAYARGLRARRTDAVLHDSDTVTDAIYEAGYQSPSRFYADSSDRLGMTPSAWREGGRGVTIRYALADTVLGPMLLAATDKGICRLSFDENEAALRARFPRATIEPGGEPMRALVEAAVAACERPHEMPDLPLDIAGTAFQQAVWEELRRIPAGETRSYAAIAAAVGRPGAVRATGSANGANGVAVLIPCHRVIRSDGSLGGYAYGLDRKQELLERERSGGVYLPDA